MSSKCRKENKNELLECISKKEDVICGCEHGDIKGSIKIKIIRLSIGAVLFILSLILEHVFSINYYIILGFFILSYLILGADVIWYALKNMLKGKFFDENFLMSIATIGAFIIGQYAEGAAVMLFYQVGELFQTLAINKAKKSITKLLDIRPDYANLKKHNELIKVEPSIVEIGDLIVVKPGEKIPLDGIIVDGESLVETATLTGEAIPRKVKPDNDVLSGCINQNGVLTIRVTKKFSESTVSKIIDLVENATVKKAPTEKFITKFARIYTPIVVILALLIATLPPLLFNGVWSQWLNRGLVFLVISCPCALVISIPLGFFGGIGGAAKNGILIKGSNYLEALNNLEAVVYDKTGTLTKGIFKVTTIEPANKYTENDLLMKAAEAEVFSNHPIAQSIMKAYAHKVDKRNLSDYTEIAGLGISVKSNNSMILAGNPILMRTNNIEFTESLVIGTKVYVAIDGIFAGCITIADEIKEDSKNAITLLKEKGIKKIVMLTGDNEKIATVVANLLGIEEFHYELLPQDKVERVKLIKSTIKGNLIFIGDGINDAPVLALSDIGVAMGGLGSDAAIEAADIVLMTDETSKLGLALDIAKFTKKIVWQNIIFSLLVKVLFLGLGAAGVASMWEAVFADVGVALLAVLNALRIIYKRH